MSSHIEMIRELQAIRREIATLEEVLALRVIQKRNISNGLFEEIRPTVSSDTKADAEVKRRQSYQDFEKETAGIQRNRDDMLAKAESTRLLIEYAVASLHATGVAA